MGDVTDLSRRTGELRTRLKEVSRPNLKFHLRVHRWAWHSGGIERGLELVVWPEGGVDNFMEPVCRLVGLKHWREVQSVDEAIAKLNRVVDRYLAGDRPPWGEPR